MGTLQTLKDYHVAGAGTCASEILYQWSVKMLAAGAVLKGSSDGTAFDATGAVNKWTSAAAINNINKPWIRLLYPDGTEVTVQFNGTTGLRMKYSHSAGFIGGAASATQTPSASDEVPCQPGPTFAGTDAAPAFKPILPAAANTTVQMYVDMRTNPISWYVAAYPNGGGAAIFGWFMDPVQNFETGETDFYVFYGSGSSPFVKGELTNPADSNNAGTTGFCQAWLYQEIGGSKGFFVVPALHPVDANGNSVVNGGVTSARTAKDPSFMVQYVRMNNVAAPNGWKGTSTLFRWAGIKKTPAQNGQVAAASDREYVGDVIALWDSTAGAWT